MLSSYIPGVFCVVLLRLIPQALPTVFSATSEVRSCDLHSEINTDADMSSNNSQHHINNDTAQDDDCSYTKHCIENTASGIDSLCFTY